MHVYFWCKSLISKVLREIKQLNIENNQIYAKVLCAFKGEPLFHSPQQIANITYFSSVVYKIQQSKQILKKYPGLRGDNYVSLV